MANHDSTGSVPAGIGSVTATKRRSFVLRMRSVTLIRSPALNVFCEYVPLDAEALVERLVQHARGRVAEAHQIEQRAGALALERDRNIGSRRAFCNCIIGTSWFFASCCGP